MCFEITHSPLLKYAIVGLLAAHRFYLLPHFEDHVWGKKETLWSGLYKLLWLNQTNFTLKVIMFNYRWLPLFTAQQRGTKVISTMVTVHHLVMCLLCDFITQKHSYGNFLWQWAMIPLPFWRQHHQAAVGSTLRRLVFLCPGGLYKRFTLNQEKKENS